MVRKVLSLIAGLMIFVSISWIVIFGFIKTNYTDQIQLSSSHDVEEIYSYITNPNRFPEWIQGYYRSQRVTSQSELTKSIYLVSIEEDGEDYKVIYTTKKQAVEQQLLQKVEHPFYIMSTELRIIQNSSSTHTIQIKMDMTGDGFASQLFAPFFATEVLKEYKEQYQLAIMAIQ